MLRLGGRSWWNRLALVGAVLLAPLGGMTSCQKTPSKGLAVLLGGAGESFFREDLEGYAVGLRKRGWEVRAAAGPSGLKGVPGSQPGTVVEVVRSIQKAVREVPAGGELLVVFHSHGSAPDPEAGQRSHSIALVDPAQPRSGVDWDLDLILPLFAPLPAKRVALSLVDLSCYSGATQVFADELGRKLPTCIVTLASARYVSLCSGRPEERGFTSHFFSLPPPSKRISLEEQFAAARLADSNSVNLPQVSSVPLFGKESWDRFLVSIDPLDVSEDLRLHQPLSETLARFEPCKNDQKRCVEIERFPESKRRFALLLAATEELRQKRLEIEAFLPALARDRHKNRVTLKLPRSGRVLKDVPVGRFLDWMKQAQLEGPEFHEVLRSESGPRVALLEELRAGFDLEPAGDERIALVLEGASRRRARIDELTADLEALAGAAMQKERQLFDWSLQQAERAEDACRSFQL